MTPALWFGAGFLSGGVLASFVIVFTYVVFAVPCQQCEREGRRMPDVDGET